MPPLVEIPDNIAEIIIEQAKLQKMTVGEFLYKTFSEQSDENFPNKSFDDIAKENPNNLDDKK